MRSEKHIRALLARLEAKVPAERLDDPSEAHNEAVFAMTMIIDSLRWVLMLPNDIDGIIGNREMN